MASLDPELRRLLGERLEFYRELGIYDLYKRDVPAMAESEALASPALSAGLSAGLSLGLTSGGLSTADVLLLPVLPSSSPEADLSLVGSVEDRNFGLQMIRDYIGDCTRCRLSKGRNKIVFGEGNPHADLMFVGEGPGADEDKQGLPFVGRAGQLLNNMIQAMGLERSAVYIANVVKCRPPGNRTPERDECATCSPFLFRQIEVIKPKVIVALGAVAARTMLSASGSMLSLRGLWHEFRGIKLAVTYHPAYLLRDPRQKKETWKDLQMVMQHLGLNGPPRPPQNT